MADDNSTLEFRAAHGYRDKRITHWNSVARKIDGWSLGGAYYHKRITEIYRFLVPTGIRVIEIGCGRGDLLATLLLSYGVGIDLSRKMIGRARIRHPGLNFTECDVHDLELDETFDAIILSDLVNELWDEQGVLNPYSNSAKRTQGSS